MGSTEKVSEQLNKIKDGFDNSNHSFVTRLMSGLQARIGEVITDMPMTPAGKQATVGHISVNIIGSKTVEDEAELEEHKQKARQLMDMLKNPSSLIELLN